MQILAAFITSVLFVFYSTGTAEASAGDEGDVSLADAASSILEGGLGMGGSAAEERASSSGRDLLEQIAAAIDPGEEQTLFRLRTEEQLPETRMNLAPILAALPRNTAGNFDRSAVRYALHHFFLRGYAWRLQGLDPVASLWNSSSLAEAEVLRQLPAGVRKTIEEQLNGAGLDTEGIAALAVTLWRLIHGEGTVRLRKVYQLLQTPTAMPIPERRARQLVDVYMAAYITGKDVTKMTAQMMLRLTGRMYKVTAKWPEVQAFTGRLLKAESARSTTHGLFTFVDVARTVEAIEERFGHWQMAECNEFKEALMPMEDRGTGRVRISDFYQAGLGGKWQFSESVGYLRELGALDEASPGNLRVIMVNYITGASNCFGTTKYHEVCCISECEGLLAHLERQFASPSVAPEELARFVAMMPSATVPAHRKLSNLELHRLQVIAAEHGGRVPLAGRLFAQWMHHVYPRECPYPHPANTTKPMNPTAWLASGANITSKTEMQQLAGQQHRREGPMQMAPWVAKEELPAPYLDADIRPPQFWVPVQLSLALGCFLVVLFRMVRLVCRSGRSLRGSGRCPTRKGAVQLVL